MFHIVLLHPEIPPNTGNVIRLAANTGARLHLVEPLGFTMDDRQLRRAGLDYHELSHIEVHKDWPSCKARLGERRLFALSTRGSRDYASVEFRVGDAFMLARKRADCRASCSSSSTPPRGCACRCSPATAASISNAVAVVVFEAWRQIGFLGSA